MRFTNLRGADLEGATGLARDQISWSCLDSLTVLPEIEDFSRESYRELAGCPELWGEAQENQEWIPLADEKPPLGRKVRVKITTLHEDTEKASAITYGLWVGDSFRTNELSNLFEVNTKESQLEVYWMRPEAPEEPWSPFQQRSRGSSN